jgi:hypothetical protein
VSVLAAPAAAAGSSDSETSRKRSVASDDDANVGNLAKRARTHAPEKDFDQVSIFSFFPTYFLFFIIFSLSFLKYATTLYSTGFDLTIHSPAGRQYTVYHTSWLLV